MSLKKYLKRLRCENIGQIFMEYVLLLVVMATLTIVATSDFFNGFSARMKGFQTKSVSKMGTANAVSNEPQVDDVENKTPVRVINFSDPWS